MAFSTDLHLLLLLKGLTPPHNQKNGYWMKPARERHSGRQRGREKDLDWKKRLTKRKKRESPIRSVLATKSNDDDYKKREKREREKKLCEVAVRDG